MFSVFHVVAGLHLCHTFHFQMMIEQYFFVNIPRSLLKVDIFFYNLMSYKFIYNFLSHLPHLFLDVLDAVYSLMFSN